MAGTLTKKKTCKQTLEPRKNIPSTLHLSAVFRHVLTAGVVTGVYGDIPAWPRKEDVGSELKAYFGIKTPDRIIEFECKSNNDKQMWTEGIQHMLKCNANAS